MYSAVLAADTSRAFASVEHGRLLDRLEWYGIDRHLFDDWLRCRSQRIQGSNAGTLSVTHSVFQGLLLGPTLFLIFY